jgi:hypothetical protein
VTRSIPIDYVLGNRPLGSVGVGKKKLTVPNDRRSYSRLLQEMMEGEGMRPNQTLKRQAMEGDSSFLTARIPLDELIELIKQRSDD